MFCGNEHSVFKLKELHVKQRYFWRNKLARDANDENFLHSSINHLNFKIGFFLRNAFDSVLNFIYFWLNITKYGQWSFVFLFGNMLFGNMLNIFKIFPLYVSQRSYILLEEKHPQTCKMIQQNICIYVWILLSKKWKAKKEII